MTDRRIRAASWVVVQEIFGASDHIRSVCDGFAREGYLAVAPALFDRVEGGIELGYDPDGVAEGRAIREKITLEDALADVEAAAAKVAGPGRIGLVGSRRTASARRGPVRATDRPSSS